MKKFDTFFPRFFAVVLDVILISPVIIVEEYGKTPEISGNSKLAIDVFTQLFGTVYVVLMHYYFGQTVGKMLMKVKVVDIFEKPISFVQAVLRDSPQLAVSLVFLVFGIPENLIEGEFVVADFQLNPIGSSFAVFLFVWGLADIIVFFTNKKRRALHDYVAGTVVIKVEDDQIKNG